MAKKPKMPLKSKIKIPNREIPEIDPEVKKSKTPATTSIHRANLESNRQFSSSIHRANLESNRQFSKAAAPKVVKVRPVPMAKPVGKITPRVESRLRVVAQPKPIGEMAVRGTTLPSVSLKGLRDRSPIPASRAPAVVGSRLPAVAESAPKRIVGGLAKIGGAIESVKSPLGTANATGSAIRGSRKLFGALTGGKARALGYVGASLALPEKAGPALGAAQHAMSARELAKFGAKALGKRLPIIGTSFAAAEIVNAGIEGYRAIKAQKDAQGAAERSAVKYASPLVHQQFLRSRAATQKGAMPDSTKTGVPQKSAASAPTIKPGRSEFGSAFAQARKSGQKAFAYKGKQYNTSLASEPTKVSKAIGQVKESAAPTFDSQSFVKSLPQAERSANNIVRAEIGESASPVKKPFKIGFGRFLRAHPKYKP